MRIQQGNILLFAKDKKYPEKIPSFHTHHS